MRLENYITHGEYLDTIKLAYKIKKEYGINDYYMFKKMCMIVAYRTYKIPSAYCSYNRFLGECLGHISLGNKIDCVYGLNNRKLDNHNKRMFFGVPIAYIYDFNVLELDKYLAKYLTKPTSLEVWEE